MYHQAFIINKKLSDALKRQHNKNKLANFAYITSSTIKAIFLLTGGKYDLDK